jgi:hypothetical protein
MASWRIWSIVVPGVELFAHPVTFPEGCAHVQVNWDPVTLEVSVIAVAFPWQISFNFGELVNSGTG